MKPIALSVVSIILLTLETCPAVGQPEDAESREIKALSADNATARAQAAQKLSEMDPRPKSAVPALLKALEDPVKEVRRKAVIALARIAPDDPRVILAGMEILGNLEEASEVRSIAARLYFYSGLQAKAAIPTLTWALSDKDPAVRSGAAGSLRKMGPGAKIAIPRLTELMENDKSPGVREEAALTVKKLQELYPPR